MTDRPLPQPLLHEHRERVISRLCDHFATDHLGMSEFEQRLDRANRAATTAELDALLADMPVPTADAPPAVPATDLLARGGRAVSAIRDSRTMIAFMAGVERRGHWTPARRNVIVAVWGGAELDFRDVDLPPGETEVFVFCCMGGAEIIVPPDLAVDCSGIAIMGGFEHAAARKPRPDSPVLKVTGLCIMGGVDVQVRLSGESPRDAKLRRREEQHRLRSGGRGQE